MKKNLLAILLTCAVLLSLMTVTALAEEPADDVSDAAAAQTTLAASGTCGENVYWTLDDAGTLTISGSGAMDNYTAEVWDSEEALTPWHDSKHLIRKLVIENGVTEIGYAAFRECANLNSIDIAGVTKIGAYAFDACAGLQTLEIPQSVAVIGYAAFYCCDGLQSLTVPATVETVGSLAFSKCANLEQVVIEDGRTELSECMFGGCKKLTSVTIPSSVTKIGKNAFGGCTGLQTIEIPQGVTELGETAFSGCSALENITLPDSLTTIGEYAFWNCDALKTIVLPQGLTEIGKNAFWDCDELQSVTIPASTVTIGDWAFEYCGKLESVVILSALTEIPSGMFNHCVSLTSVNIPDSVTRIGDFAFDGCSSLEHIEIPAGVTRIGDFAFNHCSSLKTAVIPAGVTKIIQYTFAGCTSLERVTIPAGVTQIGNHAFDGCSSLKDVYFNGTKQQLLEIAIEASNQALEHAAIHYGSDDGSLTSPFTDVQQISQYYFIPVLWAQDQGITYGTTETTFSPYNSCTRAEAVTFLYRLKGAPAVSGSNPFTDVKKTDYYYDAVLWAYQNNITYGTSGNRFSPDQMVTRAEFVTFLCRYAGAQDVVYDYCQFKDITQDQYYYNAVNWGYKNNIVSGTATFSFSPDGLCTRGQVVTFLWRYVRNTIAYGQPLPTPGAGPAPENYLLRTAVYTYDVIALRTEKSGDDSNVIGFVAGGSAVYVVDNTEGQYWYVYVPDLGAYGYVNSAYLS